MNRHGPDDGIGATLWRHDRRTRLRTDGRRTRLPRPRSPGSTSSTFPRMELMYKLECSGEDFYNLLADRIGNDEAGELLRRNGQGGARPRPPDRPRHRDQAGARLRADPRAAGAVPGRAARHRRPRDAAVHRRGRAGGRRRLPGVGRRRARSRRWRACSGSTAARRPSTASGSRRRSRCSRSAPRPERRAVVRRREVAGSTGSASRSAAWPRSRSAALLVPVRDEIDNANLALDPGAGRGGRRDPRRARRRCAGRGDVDARVRLLPHPAVPLGPHRERRRHRDRCSSSSRSGCWSARWRPVDADAAATRSARPRRSNGSTGSPTRSPTGAPLRRRSLGVGATGSCRRCSGCGTAGSSCRPFLG